MHVETVLYIEDIPGECIEDCTRPGFRADAAVQHWRELLEFTVGRTNAIECLAGYGAWDRDELAAATDDDLAERILWLACGDFKEWDGTEDSSCGANIFLLDG